MNKIFDQRRMLTQACTLSNETFNDSHQDELDVCNQTKWKFILDSRVRLVPVTDDYYRNFMSLTIFSRKISFIDYPSWIFFVIAYFTLCWQFLPPEMPQAASKEYKCNGDLRVLEPSCWRCRGELKICDLGHANINKKWFSTSIDFQICKILAIKQTLNVTWSIRSNHELI